MDRKRERKREEDENEDKSLMNVENVETTGEERCCRLS